MQGCSMPIKFKVWKKGRAYHLKVNGVETFTKLLLSDVVTDIEHHLKLRYIKNYALESSKNPVQKFFEWVRK